MEVVIRRSMGAHKREEIKLIPWAAQVTKLKLMDTRPDESWLWHNTLSSHVLGHIRLPCCPSELLNVTRSSIRQRSWARSI
jgi:hypothetical protein